MKTRILPAVFVFALIAAGSAWAHHNMSAMFDFNQVVTRTGTLAELDWRNPHAWIYLEVKNAQGVVEKWQCELGSPNAMTRAGFSQEDVKAGDEIVLDGILARDGSKTVSTRVVKAKDGRTLLSQNAR